MHMYLANGVSFCKGALRSTAIRDHWQIENYLEIQQSNVSLVRRWGTLMPIILKLNY